MSGMSHEIWTGKLLDGEPVGHQVPMQYVNGLTVYVQTYMRMNASRAEWINDALRRWTPELPADVRVEHVGNGRYALFGPNGQEDQLLVALGAARITVDINTKTLALS